MLSQALYTITTTLLRLPNRWYAPPRCPLRRVDNILQQAGGATAVDDIVGVVSGDRDVQLGVTGGRRECVVINVAGHVPRVDQHIAIGRPLIVCPLHPPRPRIPAA